MQNLELNYCLLFSKYVNPFSKLIKRITGGNENVPFEKVYKLDIWLETTLSLAILKYPDMDLKNSIFTYLTDKRDELSLTEKEYKLCVVALLEFAQSKGKIWLESEFDKSKKNRAAKNLLQYGPLKKI